MLAWHFPEMLYPHLPPFDTLSTIRVTLPSKFFDPKIGADLYERVGGFDHLLMMMQAGFLDHKNTVRNMPLFAKEVYPRIRDLPAGAACVAATAE